MEDDSPPSIQLVPFVSSVEAQATIVVKSPFSNVEFEHLTNIVWEICIYVHPKATMNCKREKWQNIEGTLEFDN